MTSVLSKEEEEEEEEEKEEVGQEKEEKQPPFIHDSLYHSESRFCLIKVEVCLP